MGQNRLFVSKYKDNCSLTGQLSPGVRPREGFLVPPPPPLKSERIEYILL